MCIYKFTYIYTYIYIFRYVYCTYDMFHLPILGTLPLTLHVDGCEIYRNAEFIVWSWSSMIAHADGDVFNLAM